MKINITHIENSILSSFLFDYTIFEEYQSILSPEDFYLPKHQYFYKILQELYKDNYPFDETFIFKKANSTIISEKDIIEILSASPIVNAGHYIKEIKESSKKRKLNELSINIKKQVLDENLETDFILSDILTYIENIETIDVDTYEHKAKNLIKEVKQDIINANNKKEIFKYNTGINNLDKLLGGIDDGELIIIAARPSMGKTSLISNICIETIKNGFGVLIESLEMDANKIMKRLISAKSGEYLSDIKNGTIQDQIKFNDTIDFFNTEELLINDESYISLYQLQTKIKRALRKNPNIKNIFIDHTGKIKLSGQTREDIEIGYITNTLKKIAREHKIRVFLLQQLNRSLESRDDKRPILSDLKNSGNIEEDADIVLGLYRDSYYKSKEKKYEEAEIEKAEIIILKNRNGKLGTAQVWFEKPTSSFKNKKLDIISDIIEFEK